MALKGGDIGLRAASAVVIAPAAVAAIFLGGLWFLALLMVAIALLSVEWGMMSAPARWRSVAAMVALALASAAVATHLGQLSLGLLILVFGAAIAGIVTQRLGKSMTDAAYGVLYLGWPLVLLVWLRGGPDGLAWTLFAFAVTWSADIAAYLVGSAVGGPKLWPSFSPNKTWSGFLGGVAAGAGAGALTAFLMDAEPLGPALGALVGLIAALATMAGDLWESALKRRFGVKDAGSIIPGHGGLLDRVDGLMFAIVTVAATRLILVLAGAT